MRLYRRNKKYRAVIKKMAKHMRKVVKKGFKDYPIVMGVSGANVGFPLNIIVVKDLTGKRKKIITMLNPEIAKRWGWRESETNCGALRLEKKIKVGRSRKILVTYYDLDGKVQAGHFEGQAASTIQHEIDHNKGILITDREIIRGRNGIDFLVR